MKFTKYILAAAMLASLGLLACNSDSGTNTPAPEAPRISNLKADPDVICVGTASEISFDLMDPNQDSISWTAKLSTTIHGNLEKTTGTDASGAHLQIRFKAANSGRHRHNVTITVNAADAGGLPAEPAEFKIFVFNCF